MPETPWFKDGLQFTCSQCGDCCTGAPGYVWVNQEEINAMAARIEMPVLDFEAKYVRKVGIRRSLVEYENGDCILLDPKTRGCKVYQDRPRQCRTWPFWESNIKTPEAWRQTCEVCPGSGKGELHSAEQIIEASQIIRL